MEGVKIGKKNINHRNRGGFIDEVWRHLGALKHKRERGNWGNGTGSSQVD